MKRIKQHGPTIDDVKHSIEFASGETQDGASTTDQYKYIPVEVLGRRGYGKEPSWSQIPEMPFSEFIAGIRKRNWQHPSFDAKAGRWDVVIYEDSGRFLRPVFPGYRALVTRPDGSQAWANLPWPGQETYPYDYMSGGGPGGVWRFKRDAGKPRTVADWGYNQAFREIFAAYEPRLTAKGRKQWSEMVVLNHKERGMWDCPGEKLLGVSFRRTTPEISLAGFWDKLPAMAFLGFSLTFVFIAIGLGILKPRKQMPSDPLQAMEFAQSKAKARKDGKTDVRFSDVAGIESVKQDLMEIVSFLKDPSKASRTGAKAPKGVLLEGPPGTGKTLIAKAVAGEAAVPFYQMSGSEFVEVIVGVGAARVRDLFKRARARAEVGGCIIFVDEIDAIGIKRADVGQETNEEREQTLNQLLTEMDGFASDSGVVFIAATNRADLLDPALLRAGRFDRKIRVQRPDEKGRLDILRVHARRFQLDPSVDLSQLARDLLGLSGAELENVLNEGALEAVRRMALHEQETGKSAGGPDCPSSITMGDLNHAVDRITQGVRRPPLVPAGPGAEERRLAHPQMRTFAATEAGRAVVATLLRDEHGRIESLERVSIVPRGSTLSRTIFARGTDEDYVVTTRGKLLDRLRALLAGRAAQEVVLGAATTYDAEALGAAVRVALKMVTSYGMGAGPLQRWAPVIEGQQPLMVSFDGDVLGTQAQVSDFPPSPEALHAAEREALQLVLACYGDALAILRSNKHILIPLMEELLIQEELTAESVRLLAMSRGGFRAVQEGTSGTGEWGQVALQASDDLLDTLCRELRALRSPQAPAKPVESVEQYLS